LLTTILSIAVLRLFPAKKRPSPSDHEVGHWALLAQDFIPDVGYIWLGGSMNSEAWGDGNLASVAQRKHGGKRGGIHVVVLHHLVKEFLHYFVVVD
jgi:hypothetical protein